VAGRFGIVIFKLRTHNYAAGVCIFDGVAQEVGQNLMEFSFIHDDLFWQSGIKHHIQVKSFLFQLHPQDLFGSFEDPLKIEVRIFQGDVSGLDFGNLKNLVCQS
jgi:hypothetical protein